MTSYLSITRTLVAIAAGLICNASAVWAESIAPPREPSEASTHPRVVRITAAALGPRVPREVDDHCDVRDFVLGTNVTGSAHTKATSTLQLVPHDGLAQFDLRFTGQTVAKTIGRNGPAVIYSTTFTDFVVVKRLVIDEQGLRALPAQVTSTTKTRLDSIHSRRRGILEPVVQRIAWREARKALPQAEQVTNRNTAARLAESFDKEVDSQVALAAKSGFIAEITPRPGSGLSADYSTTADYIQIVIRDPAQQPADIASLPKHGGAAIEIFLADRMIGDRERSMLGKLDNAQRVLLSALSGHGTPAGTLRAVGSTVLRRDRYLPVAVNRPGAWYLLTVGAPAQGPARVALATP